MSCGMCLNPVAETLGFRQPEAAILCMDHLLVLLRKRAEPRWPVCPDCGGPMYLIDRPFPNCMSCHLRHPVTVNMHTGLLPVQVLRGATYLAARDAAVKDATESELENMEDELEES